MHDGNSQATGIIVDNFIRCDVSLSQSLYQRLLLESKTGNDGRICSWNQVLRGVLAGGTLENTDRIVANQRQWIESKTVGGTCSPGTFDR